MSPFQRLCRMFLHAFTGALIVGWLARAAEVRTDGVNVADVPILVQIGIAGLVAGAVALLTFGVTWATGWAPDDKIGRAIKTLVLTFLSTVAALWAASAVAIAENGYHADDIEPVTNILIAAALAAGAAGIAFVHNATEDKGLVAPLGKTLTG